MPAAPATDWMNRGGAFIVLGVSWTVIAILWSAYGLRLGTIAKRENDGCLLAMANILFTFVGGGAGMLLAIRFYPFFLVTSIIGALVAPALVTLRFVGSRR